MGILSKSSHTPGLIHCEGGQEGWQSLPPVVTAEGAKGLPKGVTFLCTSNVPWTRRELLAVCSSCTQKNQYSSLKSHLGFEAELISLGVISIGPRLLESSETSDIT